MANDLLIRFKKGFGEDMDLFRKEILIRLADDYSALTCTVRYGKIYSKTTDFSVKDRPVVHSVDDVAAMPVKRRPSLR